MTTPFQQGDVVQRIKSRNRVKTKDTGVVREIVSPERVLVWWAYCQTATSCRVKTLEKVTT